MNHNVRKLSAIASKKTRLILGLMSGTSLDGLDIALCRITGTGMQTAVEILRFQTVGYAESFKNEIRSVFSKKNVDLEKLTLLNGWVAKQHAAMINRCLLDWDIRNTDIDLLASHGQTIYHAPKNLHHQEMFGNATLQIGDGDHLAVSTGMITISDFRQKHIAAGGEGAPLAVYGDYYVFSKQGENRIMLNIGGIANFTYLPGSLDAATIFSTDTGPGNTMMDAYMQKHFNLAYDIDAKIARAGSVHEGLLNELLASPFFEEAFPKTTGPELFNLGYLDQCIQKTGMHSLPHTDMMATLNRFSAVSIVNALKKTMQNEQAYHLYTSGGGMHNPVLMEHIYSLLPGYRFFTTDSLHINPDAKEALLFAVLANETVAGESSGPAIGSAGIPFVSMGKISFPD